MKIFDKIGIIELFFLEWEHILVKECLTQEEIDKKNEDNLRIIKTISNCLSKYQILSEEQLIELYKDKYPLPINSKDIKEIIHKILRNFRSPFDEKEKSFLRNLLLKTFDEEIFVDEKTYYFNLKMSMNIPLLLEKPQQFIKNSRIINRFVIGIVLRKIDPDFSKKCEIEEQGQKIDLKTQLLARYQNNCCSIGIDDFICFSVRLNKLNQNDRNKFLMGLDGGLFSQGNLVGSGFYHKGKRRQDKHFFMVVFVILLFIVLVLRIKDFVDGN